MKLFFNWCNDFFEKKTECEMIESNEEIFHFEIRQTENSLGMATVMLNKNGKSFLFFQKYRYALISIYKDEKLIPIFKGRIISFPISFHKNFLTIELISEIFTDDLCEICDALQTKYYCDRLFFHKNEVQKNDEKKIIDFTKTDSSEKTDCEICKMFGSFPKEKLENLKELLNTQQLLPHFDKVNGGITLSNIFRGKRRFEISFNDLFDAKIFVNKKPFSCVNIFLTVNWKRYKSGFFDLGAEIAKHFDGGTITSYNDLTYQIKTLIDCKNDGGYTFLSPVIEYLKEPFLLNLKLRPEKNYDKIQNFVRDGTKVDEKDGTKVDEKVDEKLNEEDENFQPFTLHKHFVKAYIPVTWEFIQQKKETVIFKIKNKNVTSGGCKNLYFHLDNLNKFYNTIALKLHTNYFKDDCVCFAGNLYKCCDDAFFDSENKIFDAIKLDVLKKISDDVFDFSLNSFFATQRGQDAIIHAYLRGRAYLEFSKRCVNIEIRGSFEELIQVTLQDEILLKGDGLKIVAKVVGIKIFASENKRFVNVSLACRYDMCFLDERKDCNFCVEDDKLYAKFCAERDDEFGEKSNFCHVDSDFEGYVFDVKNIANKLNFEKLSQLNCCDEFYDVSTFIKKIEVANDAYEQEKFFQKIEYESDIVHVLNRHATKIKCALKKLNMQELDESEIFLGQVEG